MYNIYMKSFANTGNPKLNSTQNTVNAIIAKRKPAEANRIVEIKLNPTSQLKDEGENIFVYCTFDVTETGYYNISNQVTIHPTANSNIGMFQCGICDEAKTEFKNAFNSMPLNTTVTEDDMLSYNLQTFKHLTAGVNYIAWLYITSPNTTTFEYLDEYSHLILIKI